MQIKNLSYFGKLFKNDQKNINYCIFLLKKKNIYCYFNYMNNYDILFYYQFVYMIFSMYFFVY